MNYLLDTHVLLWSFTDDRRLKKVKGIVEDRANEVFFSAVSIWEIALKHTIGKLPVDPADAVRYCREQEFCELPLRKEHILELSHLFDPGEGMYHADPFDNILMTQAMAESMVFLTADQKLGRLKRPFIKCFST